LEIAIITKVPGENIHAGIIFLTVISRRTQGNHFSSKLVARRSLPVEICAIKLVFKASFGITVIKRYPLEIILRNLNSNSYFQGNLGEPIMLHIFMLVAFFSSS
jgi:hypothetical protein